MYLMRRVLYLLFVVLILSTWSSCMSKREAERDRLNNPDQYDQEVPSQMEVPVPRGTQPPVHHEDNEGHRGGHFDGRAPLRGFHSA